MSPCMWCGSEYSQVYHAGRCPNIKSIEYHRNGTIKKVEFVEPYNNIQKMSLVMIDGEIRPLVDKSPPGLKPLSKDSGLLSVGAIRN